MIKPSQLARLTSAVADAAHQVAPYRSSLAAFAALYGVIAAPLALSESGPSSWPAITITLGALLAALSAVDARTFRLPNSMTTALLVSGLAVAWTGGMDLLQWRAASAAAGGLVLAAFAAGYLRLRGRDGLGFGDAKLLAGAGAWVGMEALSEVLLIACASAVAVIGFKAVRGEPIHLHSRLAFGPCIATGLWIVWLYGER